MKLFRNLLPSIAQVLLGFVFFPLLCWVLSLFSENWSGNIISFFTGLLADIPIIQYMADSIALYSENVGTAYLRLAFIASIINQSEWDVIATASIGMWSGICIKCGKLIGIKGLPVLQSMLAVLVSCVLTSYVSAFADHLYLILLLCFSVVLNFVLTILTAEKKWLSILFGMGCEMVAGVFSAAYVAFLLMVMQGLIPGAGFWLVLQLCLVIPMCTFLLIDFFLT